MGNIIDRLFISMTRGEDLRSVLLKSLGLAILCTLSTVPYFHHLLSVSFKAQNRFLMSYDFNVVLISELFLLFITCFLSAFVGFSFCHKYQLPGIGDFRQFIETIPLLLVLGTVIGGLTYLIFDRHFFYISPASYPKDILYIVSYPFKVAFTNETILRFCMVTLGVGILKNKLGGVILVSVFVSIFTMKYFQFLGLDYPFNYSFINQFFISFFGNIILGYLFVTRGLIYSMSLHFLFGTRLAFVVWMLG
jgi:hypothetical protein